ncbi:peroxidasin homolog isoform X1 [Lytechinus pictus]|uniref:peroxidasin homolog isoform X1 n=1 Tax=Lytechinus pictus TaxID=7653 RepID=UPI0030B9C908
MEFKYLPSFVLLAVVAVFLPMLVSATCPSRCLCFRTTVRCMHLDMRRIPTTVPTNTQILDLRFNQISEIPTGSFRNLPNVSTLLLNNNNIRRIHRGAFSGLRHLKYLYLYKNRIADIEDRAFEGLNNLEQLYLYSNQLKKIPPGTFSNLPSLERLFLNNNNISILEPGTFYGLGSLKRLRLDSNQLICNCKLLSLIQMLSLASRRRNTQAAATCHFPETLRGRNLVDLTPEELNCQRPHFVVEPHNVDATEGNNVYFSCRAMGDPEPEIVWLHDSKEILPNRGIDHKYNILDDGTLMIQNASGDDEGQYECMARNALGEVKTQPVSLRYFGAPRAPVYTFVPEDVEFREGTSAVIHCAANGYPLPRISWTKEGANVVENQRFRILSTGSLHISNTRFSDAGDYRCDATNSLDTLSATATLSVLVPPTFELAPQPQSAIEGSTVELHCRPQGYPLPVIQWRKDSNALPDDRKFLILASGTLRIVRVSQEDAGNYECIAVNKAGQRQSMAQVEIRARVPPVFTQSPSDLTVVAGATIRLPCSASGDPEPLITWTKDGVQITESAKFSISEAGHLAIHDVGVDDEGRYECAARNTIGYASTDMELTVNVTIGTSREGDSYVNSAIAEAIRNIDAAINETNRNLLDGKKPRTPHDLLTLFRFPSIEAMSIARAAEVFERTLELIHNHIEAGMQVNLTGIEFTYNDLVSPRFLNLISNLSQCTAHTKIVNCSDVCFHKKYRTYDGTCNNLQHPEWGASLTPFKRLLKPIYENGFNTPVGWNTTHRYNGFTKPSARRVSSRVVSAAEITSHKHYTHMLMQWGQFLDHDMDFTVTSLSRARFSDGVECKDTCENQVPCFPIQVPEGDRRIHRTQCIEFTRSSAVCGSGSTSVFFNRIMPREQINQITSYIDASNVYGSTKEITDKLRDLNNEYGRLKVGLQVGSGRFLLPYNRDTPIDCDRDEDESPIPCFLAGDFRANEQLGLLSLHTVWMREHNRIAQKLREVNTHWNGETVFHETRKIIGAAMQHITYTSWLPKVLGPKGMEMMGKYEGYNPNTDASIVNAFATAAFRFGHSLVQPIVKRLNSTFQPISHGNLPLHRAFFSPYRIVDQGGIDPVLRGLFGSAMKAPSPDEMVNTELTEHLFEMVHEIALDLAAINIQRGRDHALPGYNDWRVLCNMSAAATFDDISSEIRNPDVRRRLEELYGHPGNIDLFVGGLSENAIEGGLLGPTFTCLLARQFHRLREGDRFWYQNPGVFSPEQLTQIKQISLARVICDNGDSIDRVNQDVFLLADYPTGYKKCSSIPSMDLRLWAECSEGAALAGTFSRSRRSVPTYSQPAVPQTVRAEKAIPKDPSRRPKFVEIEIDAVRTIEGATSERTVSLETQVAEMQAQMREMQAQIDNLQTQVQQLERGRKGKRHRN